MSKYKEFGVAIKAYRLALNKSLEDVSAAVELDSTILSQIEQGNVLPEKDILDLLVAHFSLRDDEATRLYKLAEFNYETNYFDNSIKADEDQSYDQNVSIDYTDMVHVLANKYGVILQFMQSDAKSGKPKVVSRVGMSFEHAKSIVDALDLAIEKSEEDNS